MASPLVAGIAATILDRAPHLTPAQVKAELLRLGSAIKPSYDDDCGGVPPPSAKIVQGINPRSSTFGVQQTVIQPNTPADFTWWSPDAVLSALSTVSRPSFCFSFTARFSDYSPDGRVSIVVSSRGYQAGMEALNRRPPAGPGPCGAVKAGWIMLDSSMKGMIMVRSGAETNSTGQIPAGGVKAVTLPVRQDSDLPVTVQLVLSSPNQGSFRISYLNSDGSQQVLVDQEISIPSAIIGSDLKVSFRPSDVNGGLLIRDLKQCVASASLDNTRMGATGSPSRAPTRRIASTVARSLTSAPTRRSRARG
jgi:hypothetical protein